MDRSVVHLVRRHLRHPLSCRRVFLRIPLPHRLVLQRSRRLVLLRSCRLVLLRSCRLVLLRSCRRMFPANLPRLRLVLLHLRQLFLTHSRPRRIRDKVKEARGLTLHDRVDLLAEVRDRERALPQGRVRVDQKGASPAVPVGKPVAQARVVLRDVHQVGKAARVAVARRRPRPRRKLTIGIWQ